MRILHTSDWHLGKTIEGYSRIQEQQEFIKELIEICDNKNVNMIIISGDIYDNTNPNTHAEKLFYDSIKLLSNNKNRIIIIIGGNHDNPEKLTTAISLTYEHNIIILGTPKNIAQVGKYKNYEILSSKEGLIELYFNHETIIIIAMPYPSEKTLNQLISNELEKEELAQKTYSKKIGEILEYLSQNYKNNTINIVTGHFFVVGGETSDSERPIQLGGGFAVEASQLPSSAQYIALGHLHRSQKVNYPNINAYYSGSPIQYSKSEITHSKSVYIIDIKPKSIPIPEKILLKNYKPIEIWRCISIEEAIEKCIENKNRNVWVYIEILSDRTILASEIKTMKSLKKDILEIQLITKELEEIEFEQNIEEKSIYDLFNEFYIKENNIKPSTEITNLFMSIILNEGEKYDT